MSSRHQPLNGADSVEVVKTEVLTPSWEGVLPIYIAALQLGDTQGQIAAKTELHRMAIAADKWNEYVNSLTEKTAHDEDGDIG